MPIFPYIEHNSNGKMACYDTSQHKVSVLGSRKDRSRQLLALYSAYSKCGFPRLDNAQVVRAQIESGGLVRVRDGRGYRLDHSQIQKAYLHPQAAKIVRELGRGFSQAFPGASLKITSLVRTNKNRAGSHYSAHRFGMGFDIGGFADLSDAQKTWLKDRIKKYESNFKLDGILEDYQKGNHHWHVSVIPYRHSPESVKLEVASDKDNGQILIDATNGKQVVFYRTDDSKKLRYFEGGEERFLLFSSNADLLEKAGEILDRSIGAPRERVAEEFLKAYQDISEEPVVIAALPPEGKGGADLVLPKVPPDNIQGERETTGDQLIDEDRTLEKPPFPRLKPEVVVLTAYLYEDKKQVFILDENGQGVRLRFLPEVTREDKRMTLSMEVPGQESERIAFLDEAELERKLVPYLEGVFFGNSDAAPGIVSFNEQTRVINYDPLRPVPVPTRRPRG